MGHTPEDDHDTPPPRSLVFGPEHVPSMRLSDEQADDLPVEEVQRRAEFGEEQAQRHLARYLADGTRLTQDDVEATKWYRRSAEQGDVEAQVALAARCFEGLGQHADCKEAIAWWEKAAEQGHPTARYNLGICHFKGQGVARDLEKGVYWWRKAARKGHAIAQYNLATCYSTAEGVPQDDKWAAFWYKKAAEQGNTEAQHSLAMCYNDGKGVPKDEEEVVKWLRRAAQKNHAASQLFLGCCYAQGCGVPENMEEALKWYTKAAEAGNSDAHRLVKECKQEELDGKNPSLPETDISIGGGTRGASGIGSEPSPHSIPIETKMASIAKPTKSPCDWRLLSLALLILGLALVSGFALRRILEEGPPSSVVMNTEIKGSTGTFRWINIPRSNLQIDSFIRGKKLLSQGQFCPKGTGLFPIRIYFSFGDDSQPRRKAVREYLFYLNEFNEWIYELVDERSS